MFASRARTFVSTAPACAALGLFAAFACLDALRTARRARLARYEGEALAHRVRAACAKTPLVICAPLR